MGGQDVKRRGDKNKLGAEAELIASAWLISIGYDVFRNVAPCGPGDLIVWHPPTGELHIIDVKSRRNLYIRRDGGGGRPIFGEKAHDGVKFLFVLDGKVDGFWRLKGRMLGTERYWPLALDPEP